MSAWSYLPNSLPVENRPPKGFVLSPILFIICVSDFTKWERSMTVMCAYSTSILNMVFSLEKETTAVNQHKVSNSTLNYTVYALALSKTNFSPIQTKQNRCDFSLKV
jgi:hypothetical protein